MWCAQVAVLPWASISPNSFLVFFQYRFKGSTYHLYFMFHDYLNSQAGSMYLSSFSISSIFNSWSANQNNNIYKLFSFSIKIDLVRIRWFVDISNFFRILLISFPKTNSCLCKYHLSVCFVPIFIRLLHWFTKINFWSEARMGIGVFC